VRRQRGRRAFNIGNAGGAAVSGAALAAGWSIVSPKLIGAVFTGFAVCWP
jgi:predicted MFS family arabinose efflux permease